jgi:hypothetical protein
VKIKKSLVIFFFIFIFLYLLLGVIKYNEFIDGRLSLSTEKPGVNFVVFGDIPYEKNELYLERRLIKGINSMELSSVVHIGDSFSGKCSNKQYKESFEIFNKIRHKFVFTPGDNDWSDCGFKHAGSFDPLERLSELRKHILGIPIELIERQSYFPENVIWMERNIVFLTLHLVGRENFTKFFPGRAIKHDKFNKKREDANVKWLENAFEKAKSLSSKTVVIFFHADPRFEKPKDDLYRKKYDSIILALEESAKYFKGDILLIHGDTHNYKVDKPLRDRNSGEILSNVHRIIVPGSPRVGYVSVNISNNGKVWHEVNYINYLLIAMEKIEKFTNSLYRL